MMFLAFRIWRSDFKTIDRIKQRILTRALLGIGIAYLWFIKGLPNSFNTVMAGALAPEFIESLIEKYSDKFNLIEKEV